MKIEINLKADIIKRIAKLIEKKDNMWDLEEQIEILVEVGLGIAEDAEGIVNDRIARQNKKL